MINYALNLNNLFDSGLTIVYDINNFGSYFKIDGNFKAF